MNSRRKKITPILLIVSLLITPIQCDNVNAFWEFLRRTPKTKVGRSVPTTTTWEGEALPKQGIKGKSETRATWEGESLRKQGIKGKSETRATWDGEALPEQGIKGKSETRTTWDNGALPSSQSSSDSVPNSKINSGMGSEALSASPMNQITEGKPGTSGRGASNLNHGVDKKTTSLTRILGSDEYKRLAETLSPEELTKLRENLISNTADRLVQKHKERNPGRWVKKNLFPIAAWGSLAVALYMAIHNTDKDSQDLKIKQQELELKVKDLEKELTSNAQNDEDGMKIKKSLIEDKKNNDTHYTRYEEAMREIFGKHNFNTELTYRESSEIFTNATQSLKSSP
ncbi:hypothetical protein [Pasteuria penetrans]|uniref:hypothetical protein n=1 Tax=Pasteuria penetrans TaxID=86005 RepID=UPI0011EBA567|nr:hypothetical protein [Pasteuria penetrans]